MGTNPGPAAGGERPTTRDTTEEVLPPVGDDPREWRLFVASWQDSVHSFARRILRDDAAAADATQEVFVAVWSRRSRYDRTRPFRPWLYRVALNVVRGELRSRRTRHAKEREVPVPPSHHRSGPDCSGGDPLERLEQVRVVEEHLARLPDEARTLIVLHHQQGLSQHEIARVTGLRRTTVQSRLGKAMESLRASLRLRGHLGLIPLAEVALRDAPAHAAPAALTETLVRIPTVAAATGGTAAATGMILGGITMSKAIPATILVVAALSLATGYGIRSTLGPSDDGADAVTSTLTPEEQAALEQELAELRTENAGLRESLATAESRRDFLAAEVEGLRAGAEGGASGQPTPAVAGETEAETIDWAALAARFGENRDFLLRVAELIENDANLRDELDPDERMLLMQLQRDWSDAALLARQQTDVPFLDPEFLPNIFETFYGGGLGLDEAQIAALRATSLDLLDRWGAARDGSPLEVYEARQAILEGMDASLRRSLPPEQAGAYDTLDTLGEHLMNGPSGKYRFGLEGQEGIPDRAQETLRGHYGIEPYQAGRFDEAVSDYARGAREIMARHLSDGQSITELDPAARRAVELEYLRWQLEFDARVQRLLDENQLANLRGKMPAILMFEPTRNTSISESDSPGF